jgi:hypothetical protein
MKNLLIGLTVLSVLTIASVTYADLDIRRERHVIRSGYDAPVSRCSFSTLSFLFLGDEDCNQISSGMLMFVRTDNIMISICGHGNRIDDCQLKDSRKFSSPIAPPTSRSVLSPIHH